MQRFSKQTSTTQPKSVIWQIWEDVANWSDWDIELEYAILESPFREGAVGTLKAKNSPKSKFVITDCVVGEHFTYQIALPLANLRVGHYFINTADDTTLFVHDVAFEGLLGWVFGQILGRTYEKSLPIALDHIKAIAESRDGT
ncbi:MAG: hypothetical protein WBC91_13190 [Phototrophicaceae bacterium]